ncbi:MAG: M12 family metallo-peptidase, partial [Acetobacteraceae bacterium]
QCAVNNYSFVHELGHNLGMEHDDCATQRRPGAFNYGYAAETQGVRTVMAYPCACPNAGCRRLGFYSTPNLKFKDAPLGKNVGEDRPSYNAEILCRAAAIVSTYY